MDEYFYGITDKGKCREKNEDTFFVREIINKQFLVACVIDGVGGYQGGDVAAAIARSVIMKHLETLSEDIIINLHQAVVAANAKINEQKKTGTKNARMACVLTCAVADIKNNKCWYAHVGDTRIYLLRDHSLIKISKDHSAVGFLEESGRLSEEEAMHHPRRNEINKALGFEEDITIADDFIETGESPFLSGDLLLLCSDGLTDMINSETIISVLTSNKNLSAKAKALIDAANDAGGNDNITAVLIENNKQPIQKPEPLIVDRKKNKIETVVVDNEVSPLKDIATAQKNSRNIVSFLTLFSMGVLVVLLMLFFQKKSKPAANNTITVIQIPKKINEQLNQLIAQVNALTRKLLLPEKVTSLEVADAIVINKDSFYFEGKGTTLIADSLYKGPAFIINSAAKHIVLDSLVLENFDVGIVVQKNNIMLRNIRFINCRVPVQYSLSFGDSVVSGRFKDSIFITNSNHK